MYIENFNNSSSYRDSFSIHASPKTIPAKCHQQATPSQFTNLTLGFQFRYISIEDYRHRSCRGFWLLVPWRRWKQHQDRRVRSLLPNSLHESLSCTVNKYIADSDLSPDRHSRSKPFTKWMKRLANLKSPSGPTRISSKRDQTSFNTKNEKANAAKNNPYPISAKPAVDPSAATTGNGRLSFYTPPSRRSGSYNSLSPSKTSLPASQDGQQAPTIGQKSVAPTVSTNPDTLNSDGANSKAGTIATAGGALSTSMDGGDGSTFTSPAPSLRSLTTTLTTVQSAAPSNLLAAPHQASTAPLAVPNSNHSHHNSGTQFTHQFPSTPVSAASAIPSHVAGPQTGGGHPATYNTATANNVLTDNASILTLASSSKRRRRNSLDTNASVRALAPSSLFGGSRESLPLSVLSANVNDQSSITGQHGGRTVSIGLPRDERASVYSSSGIVPAAERSSYYASKKNNPGEDGASIRSGLIGHGRADSITRSIGGGGLGGGAGDSPLASPREPSLQQQQQQQPHNPSRRHSEWGEVNEYDDRDEVERGTK